MKKASTMETRIKHNFGMAKPEGYRKSQRHNVFGREN